MKRILIFIGLKIVESAVCLIIGLIFALILAVPMIWINNKWRIVYAFVLVAPLILLEIVLIYQSIREKIWQIWIQDNWKWAGKILERKER